MAQTNKLYNRLTFKNGDKGYFAKSCPACGYSIEDCVRTREFTACLLCARTGKKVNLEPSQVTTWPKFKVKRVHLLPSPGRDTSA